MGNVSGYELSPGQLLMWLGVQRRPDSPMYDMATAFRIGSALDESAFCRAVDTAVSESDSLRSVFVEVNGIPRRRVLPAEKGISDIEIVDLSSPSGAFDETSYRQWIERRTARLLDISTRSFDTALIKLAESDYVWYLNQHHLISDAWSTRLVLKRVADAYRSIVSGAELPESGLIAFETHLKELSRSMELPSYAEAVAYWARRADEVGHDRFNFYGESLDGRTSSTDRTTLELDHNRSAALESLWQDKRFQSLTREITTFQLFLTILFALLYRGSGESRLMIGAPAGSRATKAERMTIGLLMEIFAIGVEVEPTDSLLSLYGKVSHDSYEFLRHSHPGASNAKLLRSSGVLLNYVPFSFGDFAGAPVEVDFLHSGAAEPHTALQVQVRQPFADGRLAIDFDFNTSAFPQQLRDIVPHQFLTLLDEISANPEARIARIDLLPPDERHRLIDELNDTASEHEIHTPLHIAFERHARTSPNRSAIINGDRVLTYGQLDALSSQIAKELREQGVSKGEVVGLLLGDPLDVVAGMLGCLKIGAVYVPIDPELPDQRKELLLKLATPTVVITQSPDALDRDEPASFKRIELIQHHSANSPTLSSSAEISVDDAAYGLFTSGSTGEPKAVLCSHRGVMNLLTDMNQRKPVEPGQIHSLWTNISFDVSMYEIYSALTSGGTLDVVPSHVRFESSELYRWMVEREVASAYLPPFVLDTFAELSGSDGPALSLKRLLVGVEPIQQSVLTQLMDANPQLQVVNGYGPTETTICATFYTVPRGEGGERRTPIGRPLHNNRIYVVDQFGQPVPYGARGELYVGGHGLALGYLNRPDLTDERFIADPFRSDRSDRVYKTGDVVRYLPDGNLEFVGRIDHQIKIRGYRIEPAEVEAALLRHPAVTDALVVARSARGKSKVLVAYVTMTDGGATMTSDWFDYLRPVLPHYMIPNVYMVLDALPQTPAGKIDRRALPDPFLQRPSMAEKGDYSGARTETERTLAEIWKKVLGIEDVGIRDNFFDLGGDSIMAIQIVARARRAGIATTLHKLFKSPTVEGLAWSNLADNGAAEERVVGSVGLTPIQHWFFDEYSESGHFHQVVHVAVGSDLDVSVLESALLTLTDHHAALRQRFLHEEGQWRSEVVDEAVPPPLSVFDAKGLDSDARAQHEIELCVGFDLGKPPLMRAGLFRESGSADRLVLVAHHLIVDVVSWSVILDDLDHLYSQIAAGTPADLPAASTSLRRWTNLLATRVSSVDTGPWLDVVSRPGAVLPTKGAPSSTVAISSLLDAAATTTLIQETPKWRVGIDELLVTALVCALSEWTEDRDVCLVMEGHGRQSDDPTLDVTRTLGWFTAMFPVVVGVPDAGAPASILGSVKEAVRQGLDHGMEYGVLRYLHTSDDVRGALALESGRHALFNYLGRVDGGAADGARFRMAGPIELSRAGDAHPVFGLEVNAWIADDQLTIEWSFADGRLDPEDVERLARRCMSHLGTLMDDCAAGAAGVTSASDFPHANLDDEGLAKLAIVLHRTDGGS